MGIMLSHGCPFWHRVHEFSISRGIWRLQGTRDRAEFAETRLTRQGKAWQSWQGYAQGYCL